MSTSLVHGHILLNSSLGSLRCNGGKSANLVATAGAGSSIDMQWTVWPDSHKGPVITYMAQVPASEDVKTWDPTECVSPSIRHGISLTLL